MTQRQLKPLTELACQLRRTEKTLRRWRSAGARGFQIVGGRLFGDPVQIKQWAKETRAMVPGRRPKESRKRGQSG